MPLHPQAQALCDLVNATRVPVSAEHRVRDTRQGWGLLVATMGGPAKPMFAVDDRDADGVPVRVYRPSADRDLPVLVVAHGGGWVIGNVDEFDVIARQLAAASGAVVVSVDYRLSPEHPFPVPLEDCWHALEWTAAHAIEIGADPSRLAIGGDSAGGNLAAVCALRARDRAGPALALQVLVYPVCDCRFDTESYVSNAQGFLLEAEQMKWFFDCYTGGKADPADGRISPLRVSDLHGVAPAVVLTAEYDPLRDEGEAYAQRLHEAGVAVEHRRYDGLIHGFFGLSDAFDASRDAVDYVATALRRAFGTLDA
ncbi:MAG: alpha/beta hydrolase [Acidimicrobiia bacterium]